MNEQPKSREERPREGMAGMASERTLINVDKKRLIGPDQVGTIVQ
jgi:hypothetical protein